MSHQIEEPLSPDAEAVSVDSPVDADAETTAEAAAGETTTEPTEATSTEAAAEATEEPAEEAPAAAEEAAAEETTEAAAEAAPAEEPVEAAAEVAEAAPAEAAAEETTEAVAEVAEDAPAEAAAEEPAEAAAEAAPAEEPVEAAAEVAEDAPAEATAEAPAEAAGEEVTEAPTEATAEATEAVAAASAEAATPVSTATAAASGDSEPSETMVMLEKALADKTLVEGQVIGWNKGGYHVAIGKIAAFCPVSQIEIGNPRSPKRYLDRSFKFQVIEIQQDGRRVVISRANALKAEREQKAALVRERLNVGDKLEGKVSSITTFGAFVDLGGGIEGLVHVSEISRRRVEHAKELVKTGQKVNVQVLKIEKGGQRISLSMKRLEKDPWSGVAERFPVGESFEGKILRKTDFGLFVEVETGIEGLVHLSRLPHGTTLEDESLEIGNTVKVWIHDVEAKRRRLSLSLREVSNANPWKGVRDRFPEGEIVKGTVERLARFGVFIELEPGLTGLLPFSTLAGAGNPRRQYHPGKEVQIRVLSIDSDRKRISLGTEQSKAEGSQQDFKDYLKTQKKERGGGMTAMEAAFAKLKSAQG